MKELVHDIMSIFSPQTINPVLIRADLTQQEIASLQASGVTKVSWATSMEELNDAFVQKALAAGAAGYHITDVEKHKPGHDEQHILSGTASLYFVSLKEAHG
ncbi:DUF1471 domain-containing protein [Pantoea sp. A4]|uniref:DUF1471 domain-containing protein n=1 Tax=Pantoea sp. A4 TaxID=1225184 RepID=UPI00037835C9|nr:DUF1471 domain-containing protein [Pantoea sp. A4]